MGLGKGLIVEIVNFKVNSIMEFKIPSGIVRDGTLLDIFGARHRLRVIPLDADEFNIELENLESGVSETVGTIRQGDVNWGAPLNHAQIVDESE